MSDIATVSNPYHVASALLRESLNNRQSMAEDLKEKIPAIIAALVESALGMYVERVEITRKGEAKVKVYQLAPDVKAINAIMRLANYEPEEVGKILLDMNRSAALQADITADLAKERAQNLRSQTLLNDSNAAAFKAAFVVEDDVQGAALSVFSAVVGYIQSIPVEVMREEVVASQSSYQEWQVKIADIGKEAYEKYVLPKDGDEAIDGEFTEDEDDSEEDEE